MLICKQFIYTLTLLPFMNKAKRLPVVFLPCPGVGHINRGYESFTIQCFENLKDATEFKLILFKSAGPTASNSINLPNIKRTSRFAKFLFKYVKFNAYWTEQITFFISLFPYVIKYKPDVIFYSDMGLGTLFYKTRKIFKFKYKILFSNGAPKPPPYNVEDHIQQILNSHVERAVKAGVPRSMQTVLHYGLDFNDQPSFPSEIQKKEIRKKLNLPEDKKIVISVGLVSSYHKRMDYVVREFSRLDMDKYFLVILGNIDNSSTEILDLAKSLLPNGNYLIKQVPSVEVNDYLLSADYFILASFFEGLGRVLIEAQQCGLLPIVHDYDVMREALGDYGVFKDLAEENVLSSLINEVDRRNISKEALWKYAYDNYSWQCLRRKYIELILNTMNQN